MHRSAGSECLLLRSDRVAHRTSSLSKHPTHCHTEVCTDGGQVSESFLGVECGRIHGSPKRARVNFGHLSCVASISEVESSCILRANKTPLLKSGGCRQAAEKAMASERICRCICEPRLHATVGPWRCLCTSRTARPPGACVWAFALLLPRSILRQMREQRLSIAKDQG